MKTYQSGFSAPYGMYIAIKPPALTFVHADGEILTDRTASSYVRLPGLVALLAIPIVCVLYLVMLPFALGGYLLFLLARKVSPHLQMLLGKHGGLVFSRWHATQAHLVPPKATKTGAGKSPEDAPGTSPLDPWSS